MIVEMKRAYIVVETSKKRTMLKDLKKAGVLHLESTIQGNEETQSIQKRYDALSSVISAITEFQNKKEPVEQQALSQEACGELAEIGRAHV